MVMISLRTINQRIRSSCNLIAHLGILAQHTGSRRTLDGRVNGRRVGGNAIGGLVPSRGKPRARLGLRSIKQNRHDKFYNLVADYARTVVILKL